jgi:hypothetical protein
MLRPLLPMFAALSVALLAVCVSAATQPDVAQAARACGALTVRGGPITLTATRITAYSSVTCTRARQVVRAYFRRQLRDFEGCAVPAKNPPYDGCAVPSYTCTTKGQRSLTGRCHGPNDRVVRFRERDATSA